MRETILPPTFNKDGYEVVGLEAPGRKEVRLVHELVAEAFLGPCPEGMMVCHKSGNKLDNRAENLFYGPRN